MGGAVLVSAKTATDETVIVDAAGSKPEALASRSTCRLNPGSDLQREAATTVLTRDADTYIVTSSD